MDQFFITMLDIYTFVLIARVLFSWLPPESRRNRIYYYIYSITEPILEPIRRRMPRTGGFDFSPIIVFFILQFFISLLR